MGLTKYIDVEMEVLGKVDTDDLTRPEEELLLLILTHFGGVYRQVYFTSTFSFLDGFRSPRHVYRLLQVLEEKGFLKTVDPGGGKGKQHSWTLGRRLQNVSYWREKTVYNGIRPEDGDQRLVSSNSMEKLEQSTGAQGIESERKGLIVPVVVGPEGDPEGWVPQEWANHWMGRYMLRHGTAPEEGMFGHACVSAGSFLNRHKHEVTPKEYHRYIWWLFEGKTAYSSPALLNNLKMFKVFRKRVAEKNGEAPEPLKPISDSFAENVGVDEVTASEWDGLERLYGTEKTNNIYGPRPTEPEEDDEG